jgi:hypothetical protein
MRRENVKERDGVVDQEFGRGRAAFSILRRKMGEQIPDRTSRS